MTQAMRMSAFLCAVGLLVSGGRISALPDCTSCDCKVVKAWRDIATLKTYGIRGPDPMNKDQTVPLAYALDGVFRAATCDEGVRSDIGETFYPRVQYTAGGEATCLIKINDTGRLEVTLTAMEFNNFGNKVLEERQTECKTQAPPGGGGLP